MQKLERHPLSAAWPAVEKEVSADLLKSIETHGIREPIMIYEGRILDGWHRYTSCLKLGVACPSMEFPGRARSGRIRDRSEREPAIAHGRRADEGHPQVRRVGRGATSCHPYARHGS